MRKQGAVIGKVKTRVVARPIPGDTVLDLIKKVEAAGNEVLEVYADGVLIAVETQDLTVGN